MPTKPTRAVRGLLRRTGFDLVRYPPRRPRRPKKPNKASAPSNRGPAAPKGVPPELVTEGAALRPMLERLAVELVLDVGANEGQYARALRAGGYTGRIVSFEPVAAPFAVLAGHARPDRHWDVENHAVGSAAGTATINVAANHAQSSSLLPMLDRHEQAAPHATYVGTEQVQVRRLDEALLPAYVGRTPTYLKIDTQGFEREVLAGAGALLDGAVRAIQVELSLVPLYDGAPTWRELVELLAEHGYRLGHVVPGFRDARTGEMLQFDGVFVRTDL